MHGHRNVKHNYIYLYTYIYIYILLYHNDMFRSTAHHQAISTKLKARCNAVQIVFLLYGLP